MIMTLMNVSCHLFSYGVYGSYGMMHTILLGLFL